MKKQIITPAQRRGGKTRREITAQSFRLCQGLRYDSPRWQRISEISTRYLRAISCEAIGSTNWTQMTERQCDERHPRAVYMQPKAGHGFGLTLDGHAIKENLTRHEMRLIWRQWPEYARRHRLHVTFN